jgi:hypothetical protein
MTSNRHERRKAAFYETTMPLAEVNMHDSICAWDGCKEIAHHQQGKVYLPKGWTALLLFWAEKAPRDIISDISDTGVYRDCMLCPKHTETLDRKMKPLPNQRRPNRGVVMT